MTGPATGEPDRGTGAPTRTTRTRDAASAILIVLALGLAFRLILAYQLPGSGFKVDLDAFRFWAGNLADQGLNGFYQRDFFHDYTPGYLYVLWIVGLAGRFLGDIGDLIKIPPIAADLVLAWLVWSMASELGAGRRAALIGAILVVINPITWFDSVVWGQVDSVGVVFLLLGIRELWRDRPERSAVFAVIAAIVKPQLGILVPIVAAVTIRQALFPAGAHGDDEPPGAPDGAEPGRTTLSWERQVRGPVRIVTTGLAGLLTAVAVSAPFGLSLPDLAGQIASAAGGYPYLSVNAYNPWALLSLDGMGVAANSGWVCDVVIAPSAAGGPNCPTAYMFGALPAVVVGTAMLLLVIIAITLILARRPDRRTILVGVAVLCLAFFVVPTRVHERYLFPFYAVGAILAAVSVRWRIAYVVLAAATFANMYVVLTTLYPGNPGIEDWLNVGPTIRDSLGVTVVAVVHLLGFGWASVQLRDGALAGLGDEIEQSAARDRRPVRPRARPAPGRGVGEVGPEASSVGDRGRRGVAAQADLAAVAWERTARLPEPDARGSAAERPARARSSEALSAATGYVMPVWRERPALAEVGIVAWLRSRLFERPVRPDRSGQLRHEGGGRFDRLDVWILAVLVVAVLTLRMWRLAEPYRMHFDEVYHARTATEFLQDWRYGISHEIYEWTHPHLAKYAMAAGIVAFADDRVGATSELQVPVRDGLVEPRWADTDRSSLRLGDRLHVTTGAEVRSYDLRTRALVATVPINGASALALDAPGHRLVVGTAGGELRTIELTALDTARAAGTGVLTVASQPLASLDGPIHLIHLTADGSGLVVALDDDTLLMLDPTTGAELGRASMPGITGMADAGTGPALVARPAEVPDHAAAARTLAEILGGAAVDYEARLGGADRVVLAPAPAAGEQRTKLDAAIEDGRLDGMSVETVPRVAVADDRGIDLVSPGAGSVVQSIPLDGPAGGLALVTDVDDPKLYVSTNGEIGPKVTIITVGGNSARDAAVLNRTMPLPGPGDAGWVGYDEASQQVHVLAAPPAGRPADQVATVYVMDPHSNAVYADVALPYRPVALALDANDEFPSSDREQLLALDADGTAATMSVGKHEFSWRLPGVLAGAAMAALLYVMTRILFRRRLVAVLVALLSLVDGMFFVQSRIAMNDAYVGLFIIAAYTLFAAIWTGAWRWRGAFWVAMPIIGLLLGLALASKWVAAYAIGALAILILARSALGRVVLAAGMIVATTVLGYMALRVPEGESGANLTFVLIMVGLTLSIVVVAVLHPISWSTDEVRFAVGGPFAAAVAVVLVALATGHMATRLAIGPVAVTPTQIGFGLTGLAVLGAGLLWLSGRWGFGPLAGPPEPDDPVRLLEPPAPPPTDWLRPGWGYGIPMAWIIVSLLVIPLAVYIVSYVPWALIDNFRITDTWPPGHTGETLVQLTERMYEYHNTLTAPHAASSPWWAWPFDLKPVWFYQESFAGDTAASIYDAGNLTLWWLGVPAMAFSAWQAFRRRSLGLALVTVAFACQWIAWARIDRAAFQYHYYTSLPFVVMAVAYFLAELWHGASRGTWLVARLAAGAAIVAPAALWLFHRSLCGFVRVTDVNPNSQACPTIIPEFVLTARTLAVAVVVGLAVLILVRQFVRLDRPEEGRRGGAIRSLAPLAASSLGAAVALFLASTTFREVPIFTMRTVPVEPVAVIVALPLVALAFVVVTARDARRFVVGAVSVIVATFVLFYPNISALPLPSAVVNAYQGLLPTYVYPFQFPVSTVDRHGQSPSLFAPEPMILLAGLTVTCLILAYSAWVWRIALAERELDDDEMGGALVGSGGS